MLQVEVTTYASDALEDAMRLAQTKALNSYSWSDMFNYLNYTWSDLYSRIACIDSGYYSTTVQLNTLMTKLPPFVKNSLIVYAAQDVVGFNRQVFRASGENDIRSRNTYHISGFDLYCPDALRRTVWLSFAPIAPQLFFPRNNRDPKLYEYDSSPSEVRNTDYNVYRLEQHSISNDYLLVSKSINVTNREFNVTRAIAIPEWKIDYISCDYPYIFVTYKRALMGYDEEEDVYMSGFYKDILHHVEFVRYNPFDFTGRESNVRYLQCRFNDKTGMGVIVRDYNDWDVKYATYNPTQPLRYRVKELGFTPDSILVYPCPEMYRYLVARLADKLSAMNESNIMGVQKELVEAQYAFEAFCAKDKSSFSRIINVNGPSIGDIL